MRTNSQGSVVSAEDLPADKLSTTSAGGDFASYMELPIAEEPAAEVEAAGKLTPPTIFPLKPGDHTEVIDMDTGMTAPQADPQATPRPHQQNQEPDPDPTPRASITPMHHD